MQGTKAMSDTTAELWIAYCTARSRPDRQVTPAHIAARVLEQPGTGLCLLGREGSMLGWVILSCIMPWRSSFPCHRMCCGPDTLLWFA